MRRFGLLALLALVACGDASGTTTTITTLAAVPDSTTTLAPRLEVDDCDAPPVTFSALCEVYALLQEWHVDRPIDPTALAGDATEALVSKPGQSGTGLAFLQCAIPDPAFEGFCRRLLEIARASGEEPGPLVDIALTSMIDGQLGPFTYYVPPGEVPHVRDDGVIGGVGVIVDARDAVGSRCARLGPGCPLVVVYVLEGAPADDAGMRDGDVIKAIDGTPVEGEGFAATSKHLAGDATGQVTITLERDGQTIDVVVERGPVGGAQVEVAMPAPGVGYLRVPDFSDDIPGLVREGLAALAQVSPDHVIVDLRDNLGGYIDSAIDVASEFIPEGPVLELHGNGGEILTEDARGGGLAYGPSLTVLVNGGTASAAEVLAGALRDRRGATIVGTTTFGKDAVQIPFDLRNGGRLYVVIALWATPDGDMVTDVGLTPDVELDLSMDLTIEELVDSVIEATA